MSSPLHQPPKAIVFDFFGVICSEITPFVLPRYMSPEEAVAYKADVVQQADMGHITLTEVLEHLSQRTGAPVAALLADFWSCVKIDSEMVALIEALRGHYPTALLSNAITPFLRQILERHDLERLFDVILISAEEGMGKPDPAFFHLMATRLGQNAEACFFTDDNAGNITAAKAVGYDAVLFTGPADLKAALTARGIIL